jgi:proteic killer suppression protein
MAIRTWACNLSRDLFERERNRIVPAHLARRARRKLLMIDAAAEITFLRVLPGNRLEKLKGNRFGQWSIRINEKYRICFVYRSGDAYQVEIVDYH